MFHSGSKRYWEIDVVRGIALLMMVTFHAIFAVNFLGVYSIEVSSGFWRMFALTSATLFVFLVGFSLSIHNARLKEKGSGASYRPYAIRGLRIFSLGIFITLATWYFLGEGYIVFGILHLIGLSIILVPFFFNHRTLSLVVGIYVIVMGWFLMPYYPGPLWLTWLGLHPLTFYSIDYAPLFPWFGVVLIGLYAGGYLYPDGQRRVPLPEWKNPAGAFLALLGRNSLVIYMVHVPIILLIIALFYPDAVAPLL